MAAREKYKENTWYDAPARHGPRGQRGEISKKQEIKVSKFFVSNLPGGCSSKDLVDTLKGYGVILSTYIARKYDKFGKRFGFVSFANIVDPIALENDLKDVWIGSYKLFIALARFVDGDKMNWKGEQRWIPKKNENGNPAVENMEIEKETETAVNKERGGGEE